MLAEPRSEMLEAVAARPLAELLDCPPEAGSLLNGSARTIHLETGQSAFRQGSECHGLYVVVAGQFVRKAERLKARLTLGTVRPGDLVELAALLGDNIHTYTLSAQTPGSLLLLPAEALRRAFQTHPPLRMRLLEELAREVCRAYIVCSQNPPVGRRRRKSYAPA